MNPRAARLVARLIGLQLAVHAVSFLLTAAFAPRVLLLEPASTSASLLVVLVIGLLSMAFSAAATFVVTRRLRPTLRSLAVGSAAVDAKDVLALYDVPSRLAFASVGFALVLALATLVPQLRPQALDTYTDLTLVLLMLTMVSTAALPAYVTMRASMARVLELAPPHVAHEALRSLGRGALGRVRKRFVAAVAAPVAFVALGASLLVDAHSRTYDRDARVADATDVARAVFEPIDGPAPSPGTARGSPPPAGAGTAAASRSRSSHAAIRPRAPSRAYSVPVLAQARTRYKRTVCSASLIRSAISAMPVPRAKSTAASRWRGVSRAPARPAGSPAAAALACKYTSCSAASVPLVPRAASAASQNPRPCHKRFVSACPTEVTDTPSRPARSGCVSPAVRRAPDNPADRAPAAASRESIAGTAPGPAATRSRASGVTPLASVPSATSTSSPCRQVATEYPRTRLSSAPLGAGRPGFRVPSSTRARTKSATTWYFRVPSAPAPAPIPAATPASPSRYGCTSAQGTSPVMSLLSATPLSGIVA